MIEDWVALAALADEILAQSEDARRASLEALRLRDPARAAAVQRLLGHADTAEAFVQTLGDEVAAALDVTLPTVGERLGAYALDHELGRGGMGVVYQAHRADEHFDKIVALKVLAQPLATQAEHAAFVAERQTLARLEHPGIARLIDGGVSDGGHPYFVMESVVGRPLTEAAAGASLEQILAWFVAACDAVSYAHSRMVIHCDLKPAHVVVTGEGAVKLLDFGIARRPGARFEGPLTRAYAAPELIEGRDVDARSDVYSLGVLLHRVLGGPWPVPDPRAWPRLSRTGCLRRQPAIVRAELQAMVWASVHPDPASRTPHVGALRDAVDAVRRGHAQRQSPPGVVAYRLRRAVRGNPWAATAMVGLVVTLAALGVLRERSLDQLFAERMAAEHVARCSVAAFESGEAVAPSQVVAACEAAVEAYGDEAGAAKLAFRVGRLAHRVGEHATARRMFQRALEVGVPDPMMRDISLRLAVLGVLEGQPGAEHALVEARAQCEASGDARCGWLLSRIPEQPRRNAEDQTF